ncbi:MAG: FAD-binding protein, partial [Ruminococcus sp.]|nr:FAD-binding protein [Ruminococcus sp.]
EILTFGGSVILATGGLNGLFDGMTTGTTQNTSDAAAAVFAQGVELANLEMIQYHPTTIQIQGKRLLISEAARGEGGRLFIKRNGNPWYFMEEKYPELKNLMPRDVVSAEMVTVTALPECDKQVYLDMTGIEKTVWKTRLSDLREQCVHYLSLDPAKEPIPVSPGIHYFMGGIRVDAEHRTSMENLYASGECACQYHGANRLGGNSLLGAVYGGQVAAQTVMTEAKEYDKKAEKTEANTAEASPAFVREIREILYRALPIVRDESNMNNALSELNALRNTADNQTEINRANLALAVVQSAIGRRESRGAHKRADYPERDDNKFKKQTVARLKNGKVEISFKEIGEALS